MLDMIYEYTANAFVLQLWSDIKTVLPLVMVSQVLESRSNVLVELKTHMANVLFIQNLADVVGL
jgi:hypothetical protein